MEVRKAKFEENSLRWIMIRKFKSLSSLGKIMLVINNNSKNGANTTIMSNTSNGNNSGASASKVQARSGTEA